MKTLLIVLVALSVQPALVKPDTVIHQGEQVEAIKMPKIKPYKARKELPQPKPLHTKVVAKTKPVEPVRVSGDCESWIRAAGIKEVSAARELIRRESQCNPYAVNKSSGACGIGQALPCSKMNCAMGDGLCQVKWMNGYVIGRYGSWSAALRHHDQNNWY